ncbi:hypothetical protein, partial [Frateuria defendens]|uniref:hypothetical protein n=1 Tax=Frateuria defendens TaxID=2219559 RepID=UPI00066FD238
MQIRPIIAALRRHRLATLLIALEIALACAVLCNACFLIASRVKAMDIASGVDEASLALVRMDCVSCGKDLAGRVLAALRGVAGVQSATVVNATPFSDRVADNGVTLDAAGKQRGGTPHFYTGGPGSAEALELHLVEGRRFQSQDFQPSDGTWLAPDSPVWVTRAFAAHLWPGQDALGKEFWGGSYHFRVAGVIDHLVRPNPGDSGPGTEEWSVFVPLAQGDSNGVFLLRAPPAQLGRVLREARAAAIKAAPEAVLNTDQSQTIRDLRSRFFRNDRAMAGLLVGVILALMLVTALGITGLASFWVGQRRKQIGIR